MNGRAFTGLSPRCGGWSIFGDHGCDFLAGGTPLQVESKARFEEGPVLADCVEEVGALAIRDGSKRQARGLARAQAGFRAGRRISFASFPVLGGGSQEEFVPSATWTSQPEPVQAQDALEVREQHFDLLPFTARPDIGVGLRDIARNVSGFFVD
jgi:hypothetical protein